MTLKEAIKLISEAGVSSPEYDALSLCRRFCGISEASALARRDEELISPEFEAAVRRRCEREPLQYILGRWGFMDSELSVSPGCLIPREETELIASAAIKALPSGGRLLDLCTGSGCIPVSVLSARPDCSGVALELSEDAVAVARENCRLCGLGNRLSIVTGDVTSSDFSPELSDSYFDVITSNPPYIPTGDIAGLEPELAFEPKMALDGGRDGLDFYRAILAIYPDRLREDGVMLLEIGCDQGQAVTDIAGSHGLICLIEKDFSALDRMAVITRKAKT